MTLLAGPQSSQMATPQVVDEPVAPDDVAIAHDLGAARAPFLVAGEVVALHEVVLDQVLAAAEAESELAVVAKDVVVDVRTMRLDGQT